MFLNLYVRVKKQQGSQRTHTNLLTIVITNYQLRYILTLVDYAIRYPEAVPLKKNNTKAVAEALLDIYSKTDILEEVSTDEVTQFLSANQVTQFLPECMQELSRLLRIKGLTITPYHPFVTDWLRDGTKP